ncbi:MAG: fimbrillin family protein [Hoylesella enoeca]|uniref:fimbrillin family protein n=1 Tax=Hoylesella enoeca TaxID=76123 RepID=UPI003FA0455A
MKKMFKIQAMLLCAALMVVSCADDRMIDEQEEGDKGVAVSFNVSTAQDKMLQQQQQMPATRAVALSRLADEGLTLEDLATHKHAVQGAPDLCLIETTVEGVNPVLPTADTRANVKTAIDNYFTASGYRSATPGFTPGTPDWFCGVKTNSNGTLTTYHPWHWDYRYGRFYAVYPYDAKAKMSPATYSGTPYVEFEVEQDVKNQKDLMTACSGEVEYQTRGTAPTTNLEFYHALTAVRFAVGQNLSWNKRITKVEIKNAYSKGQYTLPTQFNGKGAWVTSSLAARKDFVLDVSATPVDLKQAPNTVIMGNATDNYTFYMLPQDLTGVTVVVTLESTHAGSTAPNTITIPLTGKWKPGTSKTYKLSQNTSDWTFHLTATNPAAAAYDATQTGAYGITSYKQAPDGTQRPVAWKVVSYQESTDGGVNFGPETQTKPVWLTGLSLMQGNGGTAAQQGTATLTKDVTDLLAERNAKLKLNPKGSAGNYYDLSTHDVKGNSVPRSTANCYIISHPGYYKIPLVYGNAIKNGATNTNAYQTSNTDTYILTHFKDHNNADITDPWIEKTNGGANNGIDGAKLVWADEANLVHFGSNPIVRNGNETFVQFEVKASDIQTGNAVIAVTKGGTVVWSWHLWFAPKDALDKIKVTNHQNVDYNFTKETLGWKPTQWNGTTYEQPRTVKVRVEQTTGNNGIKKYADITITQDPGNVKTGVTTLYQFGRKDAFPGVKAADIKQGSITEKAGDNMSIQNGIQNPGSFYTYGGSWYSTPPEGYSYYNLWSADNTVVGYNDNPVVKTVYDPCPVGFKMPASNAFTGFTANGQNSGTMNVDGTDDWQTYQSNFGHNFWTSSSKTATINFLASGYRNYSDGLLTFVGEDGYYWSAVPTDTYSGCYLNLGLGYVGPLSSYDRSSGYAVRPVADE